MSASYSNAKVVSDLNAFSYYIRKTFSTLTQAQNNDGVNVVCTFSAALSAPQQTTLTSLVTAYVDPILGLSDEINVSVNNTTGTALAGNAAYTGAWEDVARYSDVIVSVLANQASAASGLSVQFGNLAGQADVTKTYSVVTSVPFSTTLPLVGRYFRVVYTNGATLQTSFSLQCKFSASRLSTVVDASSTIDDTTVGALVRNLNMGRTDLGTYVSVRADENKLLRVRPSLLNGLSVVSGKPMAQVDFLYNLDTDLVTNTLATSGSVTYTTGFATVATAALASSSAIMTSRRFVTPGFGGVASVIASAAFTTGAANSTQLLGWGSVDNGLFWGYNGTAFGALVRNATVDTWTAKTVFNVDKLDGTGPSGLVLDPTKGNTYCIVYDGTGFGSVVFCILPPTATNTGDLVVAHRVSFANTLATTGIRNPCGPLYAQAINTTNATAMSVKVSGMAAYSTSTASSKNRAVDSEKTISTLSATPILSVLNKSVYATINNYSSVTLKTLSVSSDGTKGSVVIQIIDGPTLTNSSYADISTNTSSIQLDTAATSLTGGAVVFATTVHNTSASTIDLTPYDIRVSPSMAATIAAKCTASGTSNSVTCCLTFSEEV